MSQLTSSLALPISVFCPVFFWLVLSYSAVAGIDPPVTVCGRWPGFLHRESHSAGHLHSRPSEWGSVNPTDANPNRPNTTRSVLFLRKQGLSAVRLSGVSLCLPSRQYGYSDYCSLETNSNCWNPCSPEPGIRTASTAAPFAKSSPLAMWCSSGRERVRTGRPHSCSSARCARMAASADPFSDRIVAAVLRLGTPIDRQRWHGSAARHSWSLEWKFGGGDTARPVLWLLPRNDRFGRRLGGGRKRPAEIRFTILSLCVAGSWCGTEPHRPTRIRSIMPGCRSP